MYEVYPWSKGTFAFNRVVENIFHRYFIEQRDIQLVHGVWESCTECVQARTECMQAGSQASRATVEWTTTVYSSGQSIDKGKLEKKKTRARPNRRCLIFQLDYGAQTISPAFKMDGFGLISRVMACVALNRDEKKSGYKKICQVQLPYPCPCMP